MTTNTYFPSRTSITVDVHGNLTIKTHDGLIFTVCKGDVRQFVGAIVLLAPDIIKLSESAEE